jgi:hypothetical protein
MCRLFPNIPHYFTDHSAVKYLIIKYFCHQRRDIIPRNCHNLAKK